MARLVVNDRPHLVDDAPARTLLDVLRDDLGLTGTKYGCGEGECGACTVLVDGRRARACTVPLGELDGAAVTTVEGLAGADGLHAVQEAFVAARALQCGYCTPGMVMAVVDLLARDPAPDDATVRAELSGNVCRCGGYPRQLGAVHAAASADRRARSVERPAAPADGPRPAPPVWTVTLPPAGDDAGRRDWGWSTPGGARLSLDAHGRVQAFTGKVDAGQGNRAALTRLVAAELAVPTSVVDLEMGDTAAAPTDLGTFGSRSTPDAGHALRVVAAAAREALVTAAAADWELPAASLAVADGAVHDRDGGRALSYAALVAAAGDRSVTAGWDDPLPPSPPALETLDADALRRQLVAAVTGTKRFPSDLSLPGMLHGRVLRPPSYGAVPARLDTSAARRRPDVTVVADDAFVAVAAPTPSEAAAALAGITADWRTTDQPDEGDLEAYLRAHPAAASGWEGTVRHESGDVEAAYDAADVRLEATYRTPYIAHVPLEPRCALARVEGGAATVWVGTQRPFSVRHEVAAALDLPPERVRVVVPDFGGGFGGKHSGDVAVEAARLAQASGRPVRVAWSREEEFRWAYFRPAAVIDVRAGATADGTLTSWEFANINSGAAGLRSPYAAPNERVTYQPVDSPLRQGSYRALAATANHFARESHVDELALAVDRDPVDLRLAHLTDERLATALRALADRMGWPAVTRADGSGTGLACGVEKDARVATAAEVAVDAEDRLEVRRVVTVVDCGAVVDPDGVRNQVVGATVMGLGGALFEAIRFDGGRVRNASLRDYRVPRFPDVPAIEVHVLDHGDVSAGAGETPIIAVAPAIANAVRAATGRRIRSLPLVPDGHLR